MLCTYYRERVPNRINTRPYPNPASLHNISVTTFGSVTTSILSSFSVPNGSGGKEPEFETQPYLQNPPPQVMPFMRTLYDIFMHSNHSNGTLFESHLGRNVSVFSLNYK